MVVLNGVRVTAGSLLLTYILVARDKIDGQKQRNTLFQDGRYGFDWYRRAIKNTKEYKMREKLFLVKY